jgi:hypothetical protein
MARQRSSPYLPGVRSRLWRFIAVGGNVETAIDGDAAASGRAAAGGPKTTPGGPAPDPDGETPASAPVVALIRRLPLLFDD